MSYELHEEFSSTFFGGPMSAKGFAIHWWGDPAQNPQFWNIVNLLIERGRQESASVHFVASGRPGTNGIVACLVSPTVNSWGQGDGGAGWGNLNLVSIECNPRCSPEDRETVAELMADQHILNGVPLVAYPHKNFTSTQCPGVWEQWIPWLISRANQIVAEKRGQSAPKPAPAPAPKPAPAPVKPSQPKGNGKVPYCFLEAGDTLWSVSKQFNVPVDKIIAYNPGINPNVLPIGKKIYLVNWCRVEAGDTGIGVAAQMGVSFAYLSACNPGVNWNALKVGQELWLE